MVATESAYLDAGALAGARPAAEARNSRVARNVLVILGSQIAVWLCGSGLGILLPRYLGGTSIGQLAFASSFVSIFALIVLFGSERYLTREVARHPERAPHMAFNALIARIPFLIVSTVCIVAFVFAIGKTSDARAVVYIAIGGMWISAVSNTFNAVLQGFERMTLTSAAGVAEKLVGSLLGIGAVVLASQGMIVYSLILLGASGLSLAIITFFFMRVVGLSWRPDYQMCRTLLIGGAPFMIWGLSLLIYGTIDITMLSVLSRDDVVGWYSSAYRFIGIATFFPFSITTALLPTISSAPVADSKFLIRRCTDIVLFLTMPIAVFFLVGSSAVVHFLGYPPEFDNSIILMQILALHIPLTAFTMIAGTVLIASNREGPRTLLAIAAAVINPLLNLAAIPYFDAVHGNAAIGAASTSVLIEVFMLVGMLRLLEPGIFDASNLKTALRCLAAGVPMGAVMLLVAPFGLIPMVLLGGIVYVAGAVAFGAISAHELLELPRTVMSRGRGITDAG